MLIVPNRIVRRLAPIALSLVLMTSVARLAHAEDTMSSVSDSHMESIFKAMDLTFTKSKDHTWRIVLDDNKVLVVLGNDSTDMQFYIAFGDVTVSADKMNRWNKAKRFSRAYSDDDKNPALENDLDFAGGVTDDTIKAAIRLFKSSLVKFKSFLNEKD